MNKTILGATFILLGTLSTLKAHPPFNRQLITQIVQEHLMENPELIEKALGALKEKKKALKQAKDKQAIKDHHASLYKVSGDTILGAVDAKRTVVIFVDPYCPYCQRYQKLLEEALTNDQTFKVILKDYPLFGEASELALQALGAARKQGKYFEFYKALVDQGKPQTQAELMALAKGIQGIDMEQFNKDFGSSKITMSIKATRELGNKLGISAAPTVVVGNHIIEGGASIAELKRLLEEKGPA